MFPIYVLTVPGCIKCDKWPVATFSGAPASSRNVVASGRERLTARGRSWRLDLGPGATAARRRKNRNLSGAFHVAGRSKKVVLALQPRAGLEVVAGGQQGGCSPGVGRAPLRVDG